MANYANLLAQIAANIYSNNNQEITGDILQLQLNAMVASLGAGYQFMGVAHPADTPSGYADLRAFWLASEAGTYTNFGGLVVADDEVAVIKYDGNGWSKEVTGAATALDIDKIIGADGTIVKGYGIVNNSYVNYSTGAFDPYNGWSRTDYIPIDNYSIIDISGFNSAYNWFYDENKNPLNVVNLAFGHTLELSRWPDAKYIVLSESDANMANLVITAYGYKNNNLTSLDHRVSALESSTAKKPQTEIVLPSKLAFVQDKQFDLIVNNILYRGSAKNVGFKNYGSSTLYAYPYQDRIRISQPNEVVSGNAVVRIQLRPDCAFDKTPAEQNDILSKSFTYRSVLTTQGSGVTKKVMFIGDSITANGIYPNEVKNLFDNDAMSVQLIGTLGQSPAKHEGRGGWSAEDYCTQVSLNTYTNAFWNPSTSRFDFAYYMSVNGFSGVDYVFISLGINDVYKQTKPLTDAKYNSIISYYNEMITSIRAYNASIKIFIGLPILPANSDWALSYEADINKAERLGLIQRLIQEYDGRESEGFVVVPLYCVVDTERDFPTESRPICARDSSTVEYVTDQTHPKTQGYYKIADVMYTYIKYGTTLS